jgi:hypothetical protein
MAIAQRRHAPGGLESAVEEEEAGLSWLMINSFGTNCPSPSVTGMVPCLMNDVSKQNHKFFEMNGVSLSGLYSLNLAFRFFAPYLIGL